MKKILVVGEYGIDKFVYGRIERLNPEAPTPVMVPVYEKENFGMAGNVYKNLESTGEFEVEFFGNPVPAIKTRFVEEKSNYILLRTDENDQVQRIESIPYNYIASFDAVVISDYNKGFLEPGDIRAIASVAKLTFMDTKKPLDTWAIGINWIKINDKEFRNPKHNPTVMDSLNDSLIVTAGGSGAIYKDKVYPTESANVVDVVGAGDTFMSAFVYYTLKGKKIDQCIDFANKCSHGAVIRRGVSLLGDILNKKPNP
jgi:D-beta-D-heptose 7-phosphate kinase/D-beta-D-heptose 1-phosphate adenosyltransferase